jgi:GTP-binding protein Era
MTPAPDATSCGYVALVGAPNVGKSTLMNALIGEPLSIVTAKAQTTWRRITGLRTSGTHQLIFLDTPGVLHPRDLLQRSLLAATRRALREADVTAVVLDPLHPLTSGGRDALLRLLALSSGPKLGVVNKVDAAPPEAVERESRWLTSDAGPGVNVFLVSARTEEGLEPLVGELERLVPRGPFLFPEDEIASESVRTFVAEFVREAIFESFHDEIPYASHCEVEAFREDAERTYVHVVIYVERPTQKGILIGQGGAAIREMGMKARRRIEHFLGRPVYLDLWVKVLPGWRRKRAQLQRLGFTVPEEDVEPDAS